MDYVVEPFKIKMIERIQLKSREEREAAIKKAGYNLFSLKSEDVFIDFMTDSGTGAMSDEQWAGMIRGDESYAGARGYFNICDAVNDIFGYKYAQPVHQGRAAEKIILPIMVKKGNYVISNSHFDTTRGHVELADGIPVDILCKEALDSETYYPFKGNMDNEALESFINKVGSENVSLIIITITNNSAGGQPVSLSNIKETRRIANKYGIKVIIDASRYAENAYFIKELEEDYKDLSITEITRLTFENADAFTMSSKKDAIVSMGGLIGIKEDDELYENVKNWTVPYEGFITYGGLAGRDLEALAIGLREGVDYTFLKYRMSQVGYLGERLREEGIPVQYPVGGHAVFIDAKKLFPHIPYYEFPGHALAVEIYKEGGIRSCEIGSYLIGVDARTGEQLKANMEFCRLAIPKRVYTKSHMDYTVDVLKEIKKRANKIKGYRILWQPKILRHFTSKLEPIE